MADLLLPPRRARQDACHSVLAADQPQEPAGLFVCYARSVPAPQSHLGSRASDFPVGVEGNTLRVAGADMWMELPLLDIKPYIPEFDSFPDVKAGGWLIGDASARVRKPNSQTDKHFEPEGSKGGMTRANAMAKSGVTVTVLAENTAQGIGLLGEHGLGLWIESLDTCVLFDTGQGLALPGNAEKLGVDLDCADAVVLSHGHYDHSGGLSHALSQAPNARIFLHPSALATRFSCREGQVREIGMPAHVRDAVNARQTSVTWIKEPTEIAPGMLVTGPIPRRNGFEDTGGPFFFDRDGTRPDPIEDDQAMWIETPAGVVVLLGVPTPASSIRSNLSGSGPAQSRFVPLREECTWARHRTIA